MELDFQGFWIMLELSWIKAKWLIEEREMVMGSAIFVVLFIIVTTAVVMRRSEWNELMNELKSMKDES